MDVRGREDEVHLFVFSKHHSLDPPLSSLSKVLLFCRLTHICIVHICIIRIHTCEHIHACLCACIIHVCLCIFICFYIYVCVHRCSCVCVFIKFCYSGGTLEPHSADSLYTYVYTYIYTYIHTCKHLTQARAHTHIKAFRQGPEPSWR